jgi:hypothetical protein
LPGIHGSEQKRPDVMISTKDWENIQNFLHGEWNAPGEDATWAAIKLGKKCENERRMNLTDGSGKEISFQMDTVDVIDQAVPEYCQTESIPI